MNLYHKNKAAQNLKLEYMTINVWGRVNGRDPKGVSKVAYLIKVCSGERFGLEPLKQSCLKSQIRVYDNLCFGACLWA